MNKEITDLFDSDEEENDVLEHNSGTKAVNQNAYNIHRYVTEDDKKSQVRNDYMEEDERYRYVKKPGSINPGEHKLIRNEVKEENVDTQESESNKSEDESFSSTDAHDNKDEGGQENPSDNIHQQNNNEDRPESYSEGQIDEEQSRCIRTYDTSREDINDIINKQVSEYSKRIIEKIESSINGFGDNVFGKINEVYQKVDIINLKVDTLNSQNSNTVEALRRSVDRNQKHEDNMFTELDDYRKNKEYLSKKPYLLSFINIHTEFLKTSKEYNENRESIISDIGEKGYEEVVSQVNYFIDMIESIMKAYLISSENYEIGSDFKSGEQRMIKTIRTDDESMNGKIADILSPCYRYEKNVLKEAEVICYRYSKQTT